MASQAARSHLQRVRRSRSVRRAAYAALGLTGLGALAGPTTVTSAATSAMSASSTQSPSALEAKAIHDAEGSVWVHEVMNDRSPGQSVSEVNDIGTFEGRQVINDNAIKAEVIQIGQTADIRGNAAAISGFFNLTKNDPQQLANTWISVVPSDRGEFRQVTGAVTLKSDFQQWSPSGKLTEERPITVAGRRCTPIVGHESLPPAGNIRLTLCVTMSKNPLPVEYTASAAPKYQLSVQWTGWGENPSLVAPPDAVPLSSLAQ